MAAADPEASFEIQVDDGELNPKEKIVKSRPLSHYLAMTAMALVLGGVALYMAYKQYGHKAITSSTTDKDFNVDQAVLMARLAEVAYCKPQTMAAWNCRNCDDKMTSVRVCPASYQPKAFEVFRGWFNISTPIKERNIYIGLYDGVATIGFEGDAGNFGEIQQMRHEWWDTLETTADHLMGDFRWLRESCHDCKLGVETAFEWQLNRKCVKDSLLEIGQSPGNKIRLTGHGKGGALATVAALDLHDQGYEIDQLWSFGAPRFGNAKLAFQVTHTFKGKFWRVTHGQDPWVHLPTKSHHHIHPEPEIHFESDADFKNDKFTICTKDGDVKCSGQHTNMADNEYAVKDHRVYLGVPLGKNSHADCGDDDGPSFSGGTVDDAESEYPNDED